MARGRICGLHFYTSLCRSKLPTVLPHIIKVFLGLDKETVTKNIIDLQQPHLRPAGFIDSELIVYVAPKRSEKARK